MMALVWLIDILVIGVKILGGRMKVNPVLRLAQCETMMNLNHSLVPESRPAFTHDLDDIR
ncbi:Uncharacterised protein [Mycobacteroides abscessus subsp. abscessus]|nr:Uncharacterised protein [Mycobacteroides abscessus subsp. abscessus]